MADGSGKVGVSAVTILFADISDSTTLYAQRGDATAFTLASACLEVAESCIRAAGGRVVKRLGDGLLALFERPAPAVEAAVQLQRSLAESSAALSCENLRVHCGISSGPAVLASDDVYGDVVNVAARLVGLASSDEIFLSGTVYDALPAAMRDKARLIDPLPLRNRPRAVLVYEYMSEEIDATVSAPPRPRAAMPTLEIRHGDLRLLVGADPAKPTLSIGRHARHDIRIDHEAVSRDHAKIILRGDRFVLTDRSTNGTYIHVQSGPILRVVRDEVALTGSGRIVPGVETEPPILYLVAAL